MIVYVFMRRRQALQWMVGVPAATGLLPAQQEELKKIDLAVPDAVGAPVLKFFNPGQFAALDRLADLIAPPLGSTPGAKDAEAAGFLDFLLSKSPRDRQTLYATGCDELNKRAQARYHLTFAKLDATQAAALLAPLAEAWTYQPKADPFARFLVQAKRDILKATANSSAVAAAGRSRRATGVNPYWHAVE
jgi:hypothetical protein